MKVQLKMHLIYLKWKHKMGLINYAKQNIW